MIVFFLHGWQSNKLEKIPPGAFDNLSNLRELYLQNNLLSNEGMDNETFRWTEILMHKDTQLKGHTYCSCIFMAIHKKSVSLLKDVFMCFRPTPDMSIYLLKII